MFTELFKSITYDSSIPIITQEEMKLIIQKSLGTKLHQNAIVVLADAKYTTISEYKISEIYMDSGLRNFQYREEVNDCDDASLLFKSALVKVPVPTGRLNIPMRQELYSVTFLLHTL